MDHLINSGSDVQGIITSYLGSDEDVSNLFNKLGCERRHVWRATLKRDYFNSPWAITSFIAAILLLVLTLTGALFAILSFAIHKS
ncbi:Protein of unknown function DUF247 [Macleaya cordata]|uniref:Uncharacterized protein n=1 Tax=Macleaya cordata TaxID=56857 RepID=A0A200Q4J3_MACCD|nr:Protein of unknown function DUF247 [Macleaya cordata]